MPSTTEERVRQALRKLVGLELTATARSADLRGFHFGELRPYRDRTVGELALHIQCAWRIEGSGGVLTGRSDLWQPALNLWGADFERWDHERDGNLQDKRIAEWLGHHDPRPGVCLEAEFRPVVLAARAMPFGGAEIDFSGGCRLTLFPAGSAGEDWRLFQPGDDDAPHFVVAGGRVAEAE
ncbi:MAG: hypothetical protein WAS21_03085 [Geminicoccaceae bacterium]